VDGRDKPGHDDFMEIGGTPTIARHSSLGFKSRLP